MNETECFDVFMSQLLETNYTLDFFTDFDKVRTHVDAVSVKLTQLNYLIGKQDINQAVYQLWNENHKVFEVLPILLAIRSGDKNVIDNKGSIKLIKDFLVSPDGVIEYIEDTGLKQIFQDKQITNLVDYVFGIEVGLDTNARKNRSGHIMEKNISDLFCNAHIQFRQQVASSEFSEMECLGNDIKRFDFVVETRNKVYLIEANFFNEGGSKLNEVARSYSELAPKINQNNGFEFVWITDGIGWLSARSKLKEAFMVIPKVYNLTTVHEFIDMIEQ